jgi:hypothetical protein
MKRLRFLKSNLRVLFLTILVGLALSPAGKNPCLAQSLPQVGPNPTAAKPESKREDLGPVDGPRTTDTQPSVGLATPRATRSEFRVERVPIANGAELLTIFGKVNDDGSTAVEAPLLSVVRDTLGDANPENDRLRYVWMLTYARPTLRQRLAAAVPFLYQRVGNKTNVSAGPPRVLLDVASANRRAWSQFVWFGVQHVLLDTNGLPLKLATRSYRRNWSDYYTAHLAQALSILSIYDGIRPRSIAADETLARLRPAENEMPGALSFATTSKVFPETTSGASSQAPPSIGAADTQELRARLILSDKTLGMLVRPEKFRTVVGRHAINSKDSAGHNWELLRQRAEAEGLYFQPLSMPDGTATHAVLWIARGDLIAQSDRTFEPRFLNIANPWKDERLRRWQGYVETRFVNADNRQVAASSADSRPMEMIPLAVYGLDNPKIPTLLVDFRDGLNPKKREVSGRVWRETASDVLSLSPLSLPYFLGRTAFDWITRRRGMDLNQPSRLSSYSRLKLLLSLNSTIEPGLRTEIERRLEAVSPDPLTNDRAAEARLAKQQFGALLDFARRPDGLAAKIERDRRAEMMPLKHGRAARLFFRLGSVFTFGRYVHRETATPELMARMELARRMDYHLRFLREVTESSPQIEVTSNLEEVKRSLRFVGENSGEGRGSAVRVAARVFPRTEDAETRQLCLDTLARIRNKTARNELLRIYRDPQTSAQWRAAAAESMRIAVTEDQKLTPSQAKALLIQVGGK